MYSADFIRLWHKLSKDMKQHLEDELAPLTEGQLQVLELLLGAENRMKPSDLVEILETTPAAVTTLLDRMEKGSLIQRERDEKDRRLVWITVTDKGKSECDRGIDVRKRYVEAHLGNISSHNQQLLVYLLGKVAN
ncbi:MarR family winged helix-turn-helix transcriptional regulator [Gorillibacterium timonense]|uniref:MarR family winged helix-turn-helix transcriptional regulator n=1 Tax=Gorillibacterium timonense TaxID=1689269 RepID=UPI00071CDEB2|nr:MarR family transcriptional regulator [Gorillibacterium timonense]